MNQPPLNPDGIEASENMFIFMCADGYTPKAEDAAESLVSAYLSVAQPVVNSVEVVPAKLQTISWESNPEHNVWTLEQDQTFVGLVVDAQRGWSMADKITLHIERPEVKP